MHAFLVFAIVLVCQQLPLLVYGRPYYTGRFAMRDYDVLINEFALEFVFMRVSTRRFDNLIYLDLVAR